MEKATTKLKKDKVRIIREGIKALASMDPIDLGEMDVPEELLEFL